MIAREGKVWTWSGGGCHFHASIDILDEYMTDCTAAAKAIGLRIWMLKEKYWCSKLNGRLLFTAFDLSCSRVSSTLGCQMYDLDHQNVKNPSRRGISLCVF